MAVSTRVFTIAASVALAATVVTAGVVSSNNDVGIAPMVAVTGFSDYKPPDRIDHVWYDKTTENNPTDMSKYPYRAIFFGGTKTGSTSTIYYVGSKTPIANLLTFEYESTKTTYQPGYIRAKFDPSKVGVDKDVCIWYHSWSGIQSSGFTQEWWAAAYWPHSIQSYFYFDFFYDHCGNWEPPGVRSIYNVPYNYIITCKEPNGSGGGQSGGGQKPPESSSSSSSGSSSSGGSSSSESSVDESSDDSSSAVESSEPEPNGATGGADGDTGEKGDSWKFPSMGEPDVTGEPGGFQDLQPGGNGDWGPNNLQPGGNGDWGPNDLQPGGNGDWGPNDLQPGGNGEWGPEYWDLDIDDWGLIDFMK